MITQSGVEVLRKPHLGCPTAGDIAAQAARVRRFGGAIDSPLLHHLWLVAAMCWTRSGGNVLYGLWGLVHDAHEVVTGEVVVPFKCGAMREEQEWLDFKIRGRFLGPGFAEALPEAVVAHVKMADLDACDLEAAHFALRGYDRRTTGVDGRERFESDIWSRFVVFLFHAHPSATWERWAEDTLLMAEHGNFQGVCVVFDVLVNEFMAWNARYLGEHSA